MSEDIPWKTDPNWRPPPEPPKPAAATTPPPTAEPAQYQPTPRPEPPWAAIPEIPWSSIGWRMGGGENHLRGWYAYVREHLTTRAALLAHLQKYPPAPYRFRMFLLSLLTEQKPEPMPPGEPEQFWSALDAATTPRTAAAFWRALDAVTARDTADFWRVLRRWNLLADDAAYPTFVRNFETANLPPPWSGYAGFGGPALTMQLNSRATGWWARWMFETKADLEAQLAAYPANDLWKEALELIRQRIDPAWERGCRVGAACLIASMVVHGTLPPPWSRDQPPIPPAPDPRLNPAGPPPPLDASKSPAMPGSASKAAEPDDREQWKRWAFETFDDPASWRAYLERWPPPAEWSEELQKDVFREINRE